LCTDNDDKVLQFPHGTLVKFLSVTFPSISVYGRNLKQLVFMNKLILMIGLSKVRIKRENPTYAMLFNWLNYVQNK